jgi:hypothetical protein
MRALIRSRREFEHSHLLSSVATNVIADDTNGEVDVSSAISRPV